MTEEGRRVSCPVPSTPPVFRYSPDRHTLLSKASFHKKRPFQPLSVQIASYTKKLFMIKDFCLQRGTQTLSSGNAAIARSSGDGDSKVPRPILWTFKSVGEPDKDGDSSCSPKRRLLLPAEYPVSPPRRTDGSSIKGVESAAKQ